MSSQNGIMSLEHFCQFMSKHNLCQSIGIAGRSGGLQTQNCTTEPAREHSRQKTKACHHVDDNETCTLEKPDICHVTPVKW